MGVENILSLAEVRELSFKRLCTLARSRQQGLRESVRSLGRAVAGAAPQDRKELQSHWKLMGQSCSRLVLEVEAFQRWVAWARRAMRELGAEEKGCTYLHRWISEADISLWLLDPACRCLALVKSWGRSALTKDPARKLGFWADELKMGAWLAGFRVLGDPLPDLTAVRLQYHAEGSEEPVCVKNTFLDSAPRTEMRRSHSSSSTEGSVLLDAIPSPKRQAGVAKPTTAKSDISETGEGGRMVSCAKPMGMENKVANLKVTTLEHVSVAVDPDGAKTDPSPQGTPQSRKSGKLYEKVVREAVATPVKKRLDLGAGSPIATPPLCEEGPSAQLAKGAPTTTSWWKQAADICPITNFPVSLLPYPPFKLQIGCTAGEASPKAVGVYTHLVDGCFLVVQVLAHLRFEALGQQLTKLDVLALDQYMKRCRLGHFRLGRALQLLEEGGEEAERELEVLRDQARRRLTSLRQIQRIRLTRHSSGRSCH